MSEVLRHRGPDDEGFLISDGSERILLRGNDTISELNSLPHISNNEVRAVLGLAHRRLSIIDLEASGHQPMQRKHLSIVFNGEIYNYRELRAALENEGVKFFTPGDTEVLLAAYERWGKKCVERFIGMWAFCIYDHEKQALFLSRDRFGIKPLYFYFQNGTFAFGSEMKALLSLSVVQRSANLNAVLEYISFGTTANPSGNLFSEIDILPPAHNLLFDISSSSFIIEKYYDLEEAVKNAGPSKDAQQEFTSLLNDSVDLHLRADVSVGSTLSGGLDSSTVVAMAAQKMHGNTFKTFTASYREKNIDESDYARLVSDAIPNVKPYYAYPDIRRYWEDFEKITWHQDLPISSTSMFAQWEVMKLARHEGIKVLLDGQGADEILGGYYNFAGLYLIELLKAFRLRAFYLEKQALKTNFVSGINTALGRAFFYFLPGTLQRTIRAEKRLGMGFVSESFASRLSEIQVPERGGKTFREQSFLSMQFGLQDLLRYEDRNSMAFSIESRVPFLDHRVVEFCIALDNDWKIKNGWTKYILRKSAEPLLDKKVTWRKDKMGFLTPQKTWLESSGKELKEFIEDGEMPPVIDKNKLLAVLHKDITESVHLSEFWRVVSFIKWWQVFKVKLNG